MQACTLLNGFAASVLVFTFAFAGCQSSTSTPAEAPASGESTASAAEPSAAEAADAPGTADKADNGEKWEGEAEATSNNAPATNRDAEETRTTAVIQKQIIDNRKPFRACYDKARKEVPDLRGTLTLHFVLDPEGNVKKAEPNLERSDIKTANVTDCAIAVLKGMKFPPSSRGMETTVNYPFDFKP
jgi:hypothetical protein